NMDDDYNKKQRVPTIKELLYVATGVGLAAVVNRTQAKPFFSSIQRHIIGGTVGYAVSQVAANFEKKRLLQKDMLIQDYVRRHPEDFPDIKVYFKEVLEPWTPIR
ncbi:unnamed protein product, partial [Owenia fusiformis]